MSNLNIPELHVVEQRDQRIDKNTLQPIYVKTMMLPLAVFIDTSYRRKYAYALRGYEYTNPHFMGNCVNVQAPPEPYISDEPVGGIQRSAVLIEDLIIKRVESIEQVNKNTIFDLLD